MSTTHHSWRRIGLGWLGFLVLIPVVTASQVSLQQKVFEALSEQLQRPDRARSRAFLDHLGGSSGLDEPVLRQRLRALLDTLETHRESRSPTWRELTELGGSRAPPKKVDRLLKELRKRADKILKKKGDYSLTDLLSDAAARADMPDYRARAILLAAIGVDPNSAAVFTGLPPRVGLLLRVRNFSMADTDAVRLSPLYGAAGLPPGGVGAGSPLARMAVTAPMVYYMKREMERSDHVRWVVTAPPPRAAPECGLHLDIVRFGTSWRQLSAATDERPAQFVLHLSMELQVDLYHYALENVIYTERKEYRYDLPPELDDETRPGLQFDRYYERVVRDVCASVDGFLAQ